ncbi:MAG: porin, partial [Acidobacteria bacterium]|nr:porin [Acidobacteriota bacterium]
VRELRRRVQELERRLAELEGGRAAAPAVAPPVPPSAATPDHAEGDEDETGTHIFFKHTRVSGFVDAYFGYNFNRPSSRTNAYRAFDTKHNQFAFNEAGLTFEREPDPETSRLGYRLDLRFGPAADSLHAFEPGDIEIYKNVLQAYGSYLAPVGRGLRLDFGKFLSWQGAESPDTHENWNYSPGLLFQLAQPGYHAGARASFEVHPRLTLLGAVINGWDNVEENNSGKSFAVGAILKPTSKIELTQTYIGGPEQADDRRNRRHLFDTIISYDVNDRLSLMGNYDFAFDRLTDGTKVRWQGVAAYLRYSFTRRFALSPRVEWYADYDGYTTGTPQRLREATLTGEYRLRDGLSARLELRREWSNRSVFERRDEPEGARRQTTLTGGLIWTFGSRPEDTAADARGDETPPTPGAVPGTVRSDSHHTTAVSPDAPAPSGVSHQRDATRRLEPAREPNAAAARQTPEVRRLIDVPVTAVLPRSRGN